MTLRLQVNAIAVTAAWLRLQDEVTAAVPGGVSDEFASTYPCGRITRVGGKMIAASDAYVGEKPLLQCDFLGGDKKAAWLAAETCRAVLVQRFHGHIALEDLEAQFNVHVVRPGGIRETTDTARPGPDASTKPGRAVPAGKPQASFDVLITFTP